MFILRYFLWALSSCFPRCTGIIDGIRWLPHPELWLSLGWRAGELSTSFLTVQTPWAEAMGRVWTNSISPKSPRWYLRLESPVCPVTGDLPEIRDKDIAAGTQPGWDKANLSLPGKLGENVSSRVTNITFLHWPWARDTGVGRGGGASLIFKSEASVIVQSPERVPETRPST